MIKALSVKFLDSVKPTGVRQEFSDTIAQNLVFLVQPSGAKSWAWRGRMDGPVKKFTMGRYPIHPLASARAWANEITEHRDLGINIVAQRKGIVSDAEKKTLVEESERAKNGDWLFDLYMEAEGDTRKTSSEKRRIYAREIKPTIGHMPVRDITYDTLVPILRQKVKTAPIMSNRIHSELCRLFGWAVTGGRDLTGMTENPAMHLVKLAPAKTRKRFFDDYELGLFFSAIEELTNMFVEPLELIIYTGARKSEVFEMVWSEINLENGLWTVPGARTKNGLDLILPLPMEMQKLLRTKRQLVDKV